MMKSHTIPLCPAWDMDHPFAQGVHTAFCSCLSYRISYWTDRYHIHMTFSAVYCDHCFTLLLVTVVNLLLYLTHELNFIIDTYISIIDTWETQYLQGLVLSVVSGNHWGVLEQVRGRTTITFHASNEILLSLLTIPSWKAMEFPDLSLTCSGTPLGE